MTIIDHVQIKLMNIMVRIQIVIDMYKIRCILLIRIMLQLVNNHELNELSNAKTFILGPYNVNGKEVTIKDGIFTTSVDTHILQRDKIILGIQEQNYRMIEQINNL